MKVNDTAYVLPEGALGEDAGTSERPAYGISRSWESVWYSAQRTNLALFEETRSIWGVFMVKAVMLKG